MKASDNPYTSILITEGTEPAAPAAGKQRLYIDSTSHKLKRTDSSGTDVTIEGLSNPMTTAEDIIVGGASGTPTRKAVGSNGDVLTVTAGAVGWAAPAAGTTIELDYVEITSNVSPAATSEATATTVVTANAVAFNGTDKAIIEFWAPEARPDTGAAGRTLSFWLYDGSSSIGRLGRVVAIAAGGQNLPITLRRRLTPSNASHTYSVRASVSAGTGLIVAGAGGTATDFPAFIRITKVT